MSVVPHKNDPIWEIHTPNARFRHVLFVHGRKPACVLCGFPCSWKTVNVLVAFESDNRDALLHRHQVITKSVEFIGGGVIRNLTLTSVDVYDTAPDRKPKQPSLMRRDVGF